MIYAAYVLIYKEWSDWDLIFCMAMHYGSLLPDIDHPNSLAGHIVPAHLFFKHGGVTHTLLFSFIFLAIYIYSWHPFWLGLWVGYVFAHLFPDHWQGNPLQHLWYPYKRKRGKRK